MGYFASLARHTGIAPAASAISRVRGIEMDVTRCAEPPAFSDSRAHAPVATGSAPAALEPATRSPAPLTPALPASREIVIEIPAPALLEGREHLVELEPPPRQPVPAPSIAAIHEAEEAGPALRVAAARVDQPEPTLAPPRERHRPTLADVRTWVAQPMLEAAEPSPVEPPLRTPPSVRAPEAHAPAIERAENYTLEIGTIQIVMEGPAAAPPPRPEPPRTPAPSAPAWTHPGRYYLRP